MNIIDHIVKIIAPHLTGKHKQTKAMELSIRILEELGMSPDTPHKSHTQESKAEITD